MREQSLGHKTWLNFVFHIAVSDKSTLQFLLLIPKTFMVNENSYNISNLLTFFKAWGFETFLCWSLDHV